MSGDHLIRVQKQLSKLIKRQKIYMIKQVKEHKATLAYAINKKGRYANMNHLEDFKTKVK